MPWWWEMMRPGSQAALRDDLIRLVVGMQWVEAMGYMLVVDGQVVGIMFPYSMPWGRDKTAVDIVDEWLGVR